jgi:hypothetical protein
MLDGSDRQDDSNRYFAFGTNGTAIHSLAFGSMTWKNIVGSTKDFPMRGTDDSHTRISIE